MVALAPPGERPDDDVTAVADAEGFVCQDGDESALLGLECVMEDRPCTLAAMAE